MNTRRAMLLGAIGWGSAITALHLGLNVDWSEWRNERLPPNQRKLNVAYIPVT